MITEIFPSILMLIITFIIILIPGLLLSLIIIPDRYQTAFFWIISPFLGISFTIIILQMLVYLDIPLSVSVFPYFFIILVGLVLVYLKKRPFVYLKIPYIFIACVVLVLLVNGIGYFALGPSNYIGYGWIDQHNYVGISQFFIDKPFSTGLDNVDDMPYLVDAILKKNDRIGQSVLQGFVAVVSIVNAKSAYGSVSLLSPLLTFFSVFLLATILFKERWIQYGSAISAACVPGFVLVHLQDFLSQAMAIPFLLISPIIISLILKEKDWRFTVIGIFIFAAIQSIYTEFTPLFIVLAIGGGIWHILQTKEIVSTIKSIAIIIIGGLFINIGYLERSISVMTRGNIPNIALDSIFPFSEKVEGLGYIWFGYSGPFLRFSWLIFAVNFCAVILTLAGYFGILSAARKRKDVVSILLLIIVMFPLILISQSEPLPYQFFKMLMSVSPVLMLGVWILLSDFWESSATSNGSTIINEYIHPALRFGPKVVLIALLVSSLLITGYLASFCINGGYRSAVNIDNTEDMISVYNLLENTKNQDFIVSVSHPYPLAWVAYHGRNDRIFFINSAIGDVPLDSVYPGKFSFNNVSKFPINAKKLIVGLEYPSISPQNFSNHLIAVIDNPQGMEGSPGSEFNWLGRNMKLYLFWRGEKEQNITLSYLSNPGPGDPSSKRIVEISMIEGKSQHPQNVESDGTKMISIPLIIQPGLNIVGFSSVFPEKANVIYANDPREFLVYISLMKITENSAL